MISKGTIYAYARCSTNETRQDIYRQVRDIVNEYDIDDKNIFLEYKKGTKRDRPILNKLLNTIDTGDTICVTELSRITRSTKDFFEILDILKKKKIRLIIGGLMFDCRKEKLDILTETLLLLMSLLADLEVQLTRERILSGLEHAKSKGVKLGRPIQRVDDLPNDFFRNLPLYNNKDISAEDLGRLCKVSRATIYRWLALLKSSMVSAK